MISMKRVMILLLLGMFLFSNMVYAQPPFQQSNIDTSLILESPVIEYIQQNEDHEFHVHVHNSSTGKLISSANIEYCSLHLYNESGNHLLEVNMSLGSNGIDYEFNVLAGNFSQVGQYAMYYYCQVNSSVEQRGGFFQYGFDVTLSGQPVSLPWIIADIVLLICMILVIILISMKHSKTDFETWDQNIIKDHKNMGQTFINSLLYTMFKNPFIWLYFLGWICVLIVRDIIFQFSSPAVYEYFVIFSNVYSLGLILVLIFMIGTFASYMKNTLGILSDNNWGLGNGE